MDAKKAKGSNEIPEKVAKMSANIIEKHLSTIINNELLRNSISDSTKIASQYLKKEREQKWEFTNHLVF